MSGYTGQGTEKEAWDPERYRADQRQARADALLAASTLASGGTLLREMVDRFAEYILTGKWPE